MILAISRPRAATSVATRTPWGDDLKVSRALRRCRCGKSPCIAREKNPNARSNPSKRRAVLIELTKINVRP